MARPRPALQRIFRKVSRAGVTLCAAYVAVCVAAVAYSVLASGDPKGRFVIFQMPIVIQGALLDSVGLGSMLAGLSWPAAYALLALPTLPVLYGLGILIERVLASD